MGCLVVQAVGNQPGNFFDMFEAVSVIIFTLEFGMRVFSVVKDKHNNYSRLDYCTTFFGIVDMLAIFPW